jgi:hypothetical protein
MIDSPFFILSDTHENRSTLLVKGSLIALKRSFLPLVFNDYIL